MRASHHIREAGRRRARRTRTKVLGTATKPRLSVFRSVRRLAVQLIDDERGITIANASDRALVARGKKAMSRRERAHALGERIAELARAQGVSAARFDRGAYRYHGLVAAIAEGARKGGLQL